MLTKEDADVSEQMLRYLREEGHHDPAEYEYRRKLWKTGKTQRVTFSDSENGTVEQSFDKILIAAGRAPNVSKV